MIHILSRVSCTDHSLLRVASEHVFFKIMKRTRDQRDEHTPKHGKSIVRLDPSVHVIDDIWFAILSCCIDVPWDEQEELAHTPLILSLGLVSKLWYSLLSRAIRNAFTTLRLHSIEVDKVCKMRYPLMLWNLKQDMIHLCSQLAMSPVGILMVVEPAWATTPLNDEEMRALERRNLLTMISSFSKCRMEPLRLSRVLPQCPQPEMSLLIGPWSFGGTWSTYMLILFLTCTASIGYTTAMNSLTSSTLYHLASIWKRDHDSLINNASESGHFMIYYRLEFPARTIFVLDPFGGALDLRQRFVCYKDYIDAETFYGLFPTLKHWLEYLHENLVLTREKVAFFLANMEFDEMPLLDVSTNWRSLFEDPELLRGWNHHLSTAYNQFKNNQWLRKHWNNSESLREAYRKALLPQSYDLTPQNVDIAASYLQLPSEKWPKPSSLW